MLKATESEARDTETADGACVCPACQQLMRRPSTEVELHRGIVGLLDELRKNKPDDDLRDFLYNALSQLQF